MTIKFIKSTDGACYVDITATTALDPAGRYNLPAGAGYNCDIANNKHTIVSPNLPGGKLRFLTSEIDKSGSDPALVTSGTGNLYSEINNGFFKKASSAGGIGGGLDAAGVRSTTLTGIDLTAPTTEPTPNLTGSNTILQWFAWLWAWIQWLFMLIGWLPKVYNIRRFGAVGDGVTDDSTAVLAAVLACHNGGGGIIYAPNGIYILANALITNVGGVNPNCQIYIPWNSVASGQRLSITLRGESANSVPTGYGLGMLPKNETGVIFRSTTSDSGGVNPSVFGTSRAPGDPFNFTDIFFDNIKIEVFTDGGTIPPTKTNVNMQWAHNYSQSHSVILTTDVIAENTANAYNNETAALICSQTNNDGPHKIAGFMSGHKYAIIASEHMTLEHPYIFSCGYGLVVPQSYHPITGKILCHAVGYDVLFPTTAIMGINPGVANDVDLIIENEINHEGFWYGSIANVSDLFGYGKGNIRINNLVGGAGNLDPISIVGFLDGLVVSQLNEPLGKYGLPYHTLSAVAARIMANDYVSAEATAGYTVTATEKNALVAFLKGLALYNILDKARVFNPLFGTSSAHRSINAIDPTTFAVTFSGSWTHNSSGSTGDGTTAYANTGFTPSMHFTNPDNNAILIGLGAGSPVNTIPIGCLVGSGLYPSILLQFNANGTQSVVCDFNGNTGDILFNNPVSYGGRWLLNRSNVYKIEVRKDGVSLGTGSSNNNGAPNVPIYIGAFNNAGSPGAFSAQTIKYYGLFDGLTTTEQAIVDALLDTYLTTISR